VRDAARLAITNAVAALGRSKFEFNPSTHSQGVAGSAHPHYAPADLDLPYSDGTPKENDVVVGIDTDYYVESWDDYLGDGNPAIFHTFAPTEVSGVDGDAAFRVAGDHIVYDVSGGTSWKHRVWDWCGFGEYISFDATPERKSLAFRLAWYLGFRRRVYHKVHHLRPWTDCPHRAIVYSIPQFSAWIHTLLPDEIGARKLARVNFLDKAKPGWNHIISTAETGVPMISVGRNGEDASFKVPKADLDILMGLASQSSVTSRCLALNIKDPRVLALIGEYYSGSPGSAVLPHRMAKPAKVLVHRPPLGTADSETVNFRAYSDPVVSDCNMVPNVKLWETLESSIEARITSTANDVVPPKWLAKLASEFVGQVVRTPHVGVPLSVEDTAKHLDKPSQVLAVARVWETLDVPHRRLIEGFAKSEPTMKPVRMISSFPDARFLLGLSRYTLAFRDEVLHNDANAAWFCPGLTPSRIADKVVEYAAAVEEVIEGDFSNFDGTVSAWCQRHVMNAVYLRYFDTASHAELRTYTDMLISCPARAKKFGHRYDAGVGVRSGSPTTCDLNTVLNCFIMYAAVRRTNTELTSDEAFLQVGLAFGDDSLFCKQYKTGWNAVAKALGMRLKVETHDASRGITFLARVFPSPHTSTTSMQDPLRTWRKLHLTSRVASVPLASAAVDRVQGYLVTDPLSPVTADFAAMIERSYKGEADADGRRNTRACRGAEKPYWLTEGGTWPQDEKDVESLWHCTAARTGFTVEQLRGYAAALSTATPWSGLTLNREAEPVPYSGTLGADSQPLPEVDPRTTTTSKDDKQTPKPAGTRPTPSRGSGGRPPGGTHQGPATDQPDGGTGPGSPPSMPPKGGDHPRERDRFPHDEADGPGVPEPATSGSGGTVSGSANPAGGHGPGRPRRGNRQSGRGRGSSVPTVSRPNARGNPGRGRGRGNRGALRE
jgi:hypothetical protein